MGKVLYEASYHFEDFLLIPVFMLIFSFFFPKIVVSFWARQGKDVNRNFLKYFFRIFRAFLIFMICISIIIEIGSYKTVIAPYKNGDYKTVEGYVENYSPGGRDESFTINGVEFSYSNAIIEQGYRNTASYGGVITHNGQHLKLGYVTKESPTENIIVYIEELP